MHICSSLRVYTRCQMLFSYIRISGEETSLNALNKGSREFASLIYKILGGYFEKLRSAELKDIYKI